MHPWPFKVSVRDGKLIQHPLPPKAPPPRRPPIHLPPFNPERKQCNSPTYKTPATDG